MEVAINLDLCASPAVPIPVGQSRQTPEPWPFLAAQAQAGTFRLRCPAESPAGLLGPYWGEGDCLAPVFRDSSNLKWFNPGIPADNGDFVLVELSRRLIDEIWDRNSQRPEFVAVYGEKKPDSLLATKWLRHHQGELYVCEREKAVPLWDNRILGVLTYCIQDGVPCYGSGPDHCGWAEVPRVAKDTGIILDDASGAIHYGQLENGEVVFSIEEFDTSTTTFNGGVDQIAAQSDPFNILGHTIYLTLDYEIRRVSGTGSIFVNVQFRTNGGAWTTMAPVHINGFSASAEFDVAALSTSFVRYVHPMGFVNGIEPDILPCQFVRCANAPAGSAQLEFRVELAGSAGMEVAMRNVRLRIDVVLEK